MIELRRVTPDNHLEVRELAVSPAQQRFVATVDKSLADAYVWKDALVRAAYEDDVAMGFVCIFPYNEAGVSTINIVRLLVDQRFQGRGLGRELMAVVMDWIATIAPDNIRISTLPDNDVALALYKSFGFVEHGIEDGEVALYLSKPS